MENFRFRKKEIDFLSITGEVLGQNKYSETHVSSSGGGGYVGEHGGRVHAPTVHSTTITNHEFWIKKEDGGEYAVQLSGCDIPLNKKKKITLISAGIKGKKTRYYCILVNHNANRHWFINKAEALNQKLKIYRPSGKSVFIAGGLWLGVANFSHVSHFLKSQFVGASTYLLEGLVKGLSFFLPLETVKHIFYSISGLFSFFIARLSDLNPILVGAYVAGGFIIIRAIIKITRGLRMEKKLNMHLQSLAQTSYKTS